MAVRQPNVSALVDAVLERGQGGKAAIRCAAEDVTYDELHRRVCAAARALRALGVRREERVLLILDDTPALPAVFLGAMRIGAVPVPVNPRLSATAHRYFATDSYARVVVADHERLAATAAALDGLDVTLVDGTGRTDGHPSLPDLLGEDDGDLDPVATHPEDPAFWLYSSGSTGPPKGVVHRHDHVAPTCELYAGAILGASADDVMFSTTKLYHAYGLGNGLTFPLWFGATSVLMAGPPAADAVYGTVERFRPTLFFSVPTLYNMLLRSPGAADRDLSSVRLCASAAEPLPAVVWQRWHDAYGLTILDGIGSTEMLHIYCSNTVGTTVPGTSGVPVPGYDVVLRDLDGAEITEAGVTGDLYVRGPSMLAGYWHRRDKTQQSLRGEWFFSGDRYTRDAQGCYRYEGRADDMMKVGGLWISPIEIENTLLGHAAVSEAAVVTVVADEITRIKAVVVLAEGAAAPPAEELQAWCKDRLERYQYPHVVEYAAELPKTATGKIQRFKLRSEPVDAVAPVEAG